MVHNLRPFSSPSLLEWRFTHKTSSPLYARGNGQVEAAVKVAQAIMSKAKRDGNDVYKAIMDYRNTPRQVTGLSPAQILLQRGHTYRHPATAACYISSRQTSPPQQGAPTVGDQKVK